MTSLNTSEQTIRQPDTLTTAEHMDYIWSEVKKVNSILVGLKEEYPTISILLTGKKEDPLGVAIDLKEL